MPRACVCLKASRLSAPAVPPCSAFSNRILRVSGSRMRLRDTMGDLTYCDMSGELDSDAICGAAGGGASAVSKVDGNCSCLTQRSAVDGQYALQSRDDHSQAESNGTRQAHMLAH